MRFDLGALAAASSVSNVTKAKSLKSDPKGAPSRGDGPQVLNLVTSRHRYILSGEVGGKGLEAKPGFIARITVYLRKNGVHLLVEMLVNFILPFAIYNYSEAALGEVRALLASSAPPIAWSLVEFARHRRLDALSLLVVSGIALSLLAMIGGGGVKFLQLREKLVTGVIGLAFAGSALIGKPLIYELALATKRRKSPDEAEEFEALQAHAGFRRTMSVMTWVWGLGLLADVAVSVMLVFALSIREYLIVNPILGYGTMGALSLWSFLYGQRAKRRGEERRAKAAAELGLGPLQRKSRVTPEPSAHRS